MIQIHKENISKFQITVLIYPTVVTSAILRAPGLTADVAGREMWLTPLLATALAFIILFVVFKLNEAFPNENIIQYSTHIIGKIPGKILGFIYIYMLIHINGVNISEYENFITGNFLLQTPQIVIDASIVLVCAFAVRSGIEVLARTGEIFFPFFIIIFAISFLLLIPEYKVNYLFPLFEHGIKPPINAVFSTQSWYSEIFLITFLLPSLVDKRKKWKWGTFMIFIMAFTLTISNLATLFIFDLLVKSLTYPLMSAIRYISIFDFIENTDAIVMIAWVAGAYLKIGVYFYVIVLGTAQWLNVSNYRQLTFPIGVILVAFSGWVASDFTQLRFSLGREFLLFLPFIAYFLIPVTLYAIHLIKTKLSYDKKKTRSF